MKSWNEICNKINKLEPIKIERFIGSPDDKYVIIAYTDASRSLLASCLYICNLSLNEIKFLHAKNQIVSGRIAKKSTAVLEALAMEFGTNMLISAYKFFTESYCPINIENLYLFTDSMICVHWLNSLVYKYNDLRNKGPLLRNRLNNIAELCKVKSIKFAHIKGNDNLADIISRNMSDNLIKKSRFYKGP